MRTRDTELVGHIAFLLFIILYLTPIVIFSESLWTSDNFTRPTEWDKYVAWAIASQDQALSHLYKFIVALMATSIPFAVRTLHIAFVIASIVFLTFFLIYSGFMVSYLQLSIVIESFNVISFPAIGSAASAASDSAIEGDHQRRAAIFLGSIQGYFSQVQQMLFLVISLIVGVRLAK